MVQILLDYRRSGGDWRYAFRWVPPRFFKAELTTKPFTFQQEYKYLAHKKLFPEYFHTDRGVMNAMQYKTKLRELMLMAPKSRILQDPSNYQRKLLLADNARLLLK